MFDPNAAAARPMRMDDFVPGQPRRDFIARLKAADQDGVLKENKVADNATDLRQARAR
jgi:hypothetical protein